MGSRDLHPLCVFIGSAVFFLWNRLLQYTYPPRCLYPARSDLDKVCGKSLLLWASCRTWYKSSFLMVENGPSVRSLKPNKKGTHFIFLQQTTTDIATYFFMRQSFVQWICLQQPFTAKKKRFLLYSSQVITDYIQTNDHRQHQAHWEQIRVPH